MSVPIVHNPHNCPFVASDYSVRKTVGCNLAAAEVVAEGLRSAFLRIHHFVVEGVLKGDHNCCHNLVVSIETFGCNLDSNNQNMTAEEGVEDLHCVLYANREVESDHYMV